MPERIYLLFKSTHNLVVGERILKKAAIEYKLIPVPWEVSKNCGTAIEIAKEDCERARSIFQDKNISINIYEIFTESQPGRDS